MNRRLLCSWVGLLSIGLPVFADTEKSATPLVLPGRPAATKPAAQTAEALAHHFWIITEMVLEHHISPPARQEMLLGCLRPLAEAAAGSPPVNLSRRISSVTTEEQWTALLREVLARSKPGPKTSLIGGEEVMLEGLSKSVPGGAAVLSGPSLKASDQISGNRYVGTGIQIRYSQDEKLAQIVVAFHNGPAYRAGMREHDFIVAVDGVKMQGMELFKVVEALRGEEGIPVTVDVRQPKEKDIRTLKMIRGVIPFETVVGLRRASEDTWDHRVDAAAPVAYLQLKSITSSVVHELRQAERNLQAQGFRALILDMRFIAGGKMPETAFLADALLDGGVMWRVRDAKHQVKEIRADRDCLFRGWLVAVLVDGRPNTAVDAVVGAWQDNHRAVVLGERSPGERYVNERFDMPDGRGVLVLRTGILERSGTTPPGGGIKPDHVVKATQEQQMALQEWSRRQELAFDRKRAKDVAPVDPQLAKAIEVLKADLKSHKDG